MALILMKQIIVLFLMMGCGLAVVKLGMLKVEDSKALSVITLYLLLPSVVIHSFDIEYTPEVMSGFLLALAAALAFHGILFVICTVLSSIFHLGAVDGRKARDQLEEDRDKSEYDCGCSRPGAVFDTTSAAGCTGRYDDIHGKGCRTGQYDHAGNGTGRY